MKKLKNLFLGLALSLTASNVANAAEYSVDPAHSFLTFKVSHLGIAYIVGSFDKLKGNFFFDPEGKPEDQRITVEVDTSSIDSNHAERDKHLRSPGFLNTDTHPTASFVSTAFTGDKDGGMMKGDLTLHGATKPVEIAVKKTGEGNDPWGGYRAGFHGTLTLTPADFGINYNLGPAAATVELEVFIEGRKN